MSCSRGQHPTPTALAIVAALVLALGAAACDGSKPQVPAASSSAPVPVLKTVAVPGMTMRYDGTGFLQIDPAGPGFLLRPFPPGVNDYPLCSPGYPAGATAAVGEGEPREGMGTSVSWPAEPKPFPDWACPDAKAKRWAAAFEKGGKNHIAWVMIGPGTPEEERRAAFETVRSTQFTDASEPASPLPESDGLLLWLDGGLSDPLGGRPWSLTMFEDLRYLAGDTEARVSQNQPFSEGFAGVSSQPGAPVFGYVTAEATQVRFVPDSGESSVAGTIYQGPGQAGWTTYISPGPAFLVPVDANADPGRLVAVDSDGETLGEVRLGPNTP